MPTVDAHMIGVLALIGSGLFVYDKALRPTVLKVASVLKSFIVRK